MIFPPFFIRKDTSLLNMSNEMIEIYENNHPLYDYKYSQRELNEQNVILHLEWMITVSRELHIGDEASSTAIWNIHRCLNIFNVKECDFVKLVLANLFFANLYVGNGEREYIKYTDFLQYLNPYDPAKEHNDEKVHSITISNGSEREFLEYCHFVYRVLDYNIFLPTPFLFISNKFKDISEYESCRNIAMNISNYVSVFSSMLEFKASEIANSCIFISKFILGIEKENLSLYDSCTQSVLKYLKSSCYYQEFQSYYDKIDEITISQYLHSSAIITPLTLFDRITYRTCSPYYAVQYISQGTYGRVFYVKHKCTQKFYILKEHIPDEDIGFTDCLIRETTTLRLLREFPHKGLVCDAHIFFDGKYNTITGNHGNPLKFRTKNAKQIVKNLFEAINHLNNMGIYHRDIGANNVLVHKTNVKIIDYGMCMVRSNIVLKASNTCTLWYRPIEVLLGYSRYGEKQESWSIGCLLIRLFSKDFPFSDTCDIGQIFNIYKLLGTPQIDSLLTKLPLFSEKSPRWNKKLQFEDKQLQDLIEKLLCYDYNERLSIRDALSHPYLN
jgi:tRNA A-37 threonylcarbamoyl transferase component Bud32